MLTVGGSTEDLPGDLHTYRQTFFIFSLFSLSCYVIKCVPGRDCPILLSQLTTNLSEGYWDLMKARTLTL